MVNEGNELDFSIIVVVGSRHDGMAALTEEYWQALQNNAYSIELIFVLDGPREQALSDLRTLQDNGIPLTIIQLSRSFGESTALMCGFDHASGKSIITLPAYYQIESSEIAKILDESKATDVLLAYRQPRRGNWFERARRGIFHRLLASVTGHQFHDLGCGVRALNSRVLQELRLYGDQHRFVPVLARNAGFSVTETSVRQSGKDEFRSRYRIRDYLHRLLDIFTIFFLVRFTKKPLRFFGMIGSTIFVAGAAMLSVLVIQRLFMGIALADRPAMLLSSLLVVLGLQLFSLGLLGELIIFTHARSLKEYKVEKIISSD